MALPAPADVAEQAKGLGRVLTPEEAQALADYLGLLVTWNRRMNLVGPGAWPQILETLVQDSWHVAALLCDLPDQPGKTLDLGAGAGLPGIPLRVFWSSGEYYLVEPRQKRAIFMEQAVLALKLPRTHVCCERMESLPAKCRAADLIVSRAFLPWRELLVAVRGLLAPNGRVLVMASERDEEAASGYILEHERDYMVAGKQRFLRLFRLGREGRGEMGHE